MSSLSIKTSAGRHRFLINESNLGSLEGGYNTALYKKGDTKECSNYRGITIRSISGKVFIIIIENRQRERLEATIGEIQHGFRRGLMFTIR